MSSNKKWVAIEMIVKMNQEQGETDGQLRSLQSQLHSRREERILYTHSAHTSLATKRHCNHRPVVFLRRESKAVICRCEVFRRDARSLIGAFDKKTWPAGAGEIPDNQTLERIERVVPQG